MIWSGIKSASRAKEKGTSVVFEAQKSLGFPDRLARLFSLCTIKGFEFWRLEPKALAMNCGLLGRC